MTPRCAGNAAVNHDGIAEFFFGFRGVDYDKFPRLGVAAGGGESACFNDFEQIFAGDDFAGLIRTAAFALLHDFKKIHDISPIWLIYEEIF